MDHTPVRADASRQPQQSGASPIINRPYDPPEFHWQRHRDGRRVDADKQPGRYPATGLLPVLKGHTIRLRNTAALSGDLTDLPPRLDLANDIRDQVGHWQASQYAGVTPVTRDLINHWMNAEKDGLYFAQQEAILTAIWLHEVAPDTAPGTAFLDELAAINQALNAGVPRVCHQMATGTGKTAVMAAIILWQTCNHVAYPRDDWFTNRFLAITPGITFHERLESGLQYLRTGIPNPGSEYVNPWLHLVPNRHQPSLQQINLDTSNQESRNPSTTTKETEYGDPAFDRTLLGPRREYLSPRRIRQYSSPDREGRPGCPSATR